MLIACSRKRYDVMYDGVDVLTSTDVRERNEVLKASKYFTLIQPNAVINNNICCSLRCMQNFFFLYVLNDRLSHNA